jgi:very-short-patch-repair endonuclease
VAARNLLTDRERSLYQRLLSLYPHHKIFVQVALSQLIDVPESHTERQSIRNRFSQLVADFVLCRSDLSVVAVIELDDRSHERADRQAADARKDKSLADAGIRLVRIPAGALPSEDTLRGLVDDYKRVEEGSGEEIELRLAETVDTYSVETPLFRQRNDARAESREMKRIALKMALGGVLLIGGWFIYSQFLPFVVQRALQPLAVPHVASSLTTTLAERKRAEMQAIASSKKQKDLAWAAFYSAPASCEHSRGLERAGGVRESVYAGEEAVRGAVGGRKCVGPANWGCGDTG